MKLKQFTEVENLIKEYLDGKTINKLTDEYGLSQRRVSKILKEHNIDIRGRRKFHYDENFFENIDSPIKAYWLGFLFADGCVRNIKGGYVLKIKLSVLDENHLHSFINHIGSNQKELRDDKSTFIGSNGKTYQSFGKTLLINSKKIVKDLIKLGCVQNKTKNITFPDLREDLIPQFILGYFDGDGCITQGKTKDKDYYRVTFTCGSESFLDSITENLKKADIQSISKYDYKTFYRLQISNKIDLLKLKNYFYNNDGYCLERKKNKFSNI
jgi:hypothetical protein